MNLRAVAESMLAAGASVRVQVPAALKSMSAMGQRSAPMAPELKAVLELRTALEWRTALELRAVLELRAAPERPPMSMLYRVGRWAWTPLRGLA